MYRCLSTGGRCLVPGGPASWGVPARGGLVPGGGCLLWGVPGPGRMPAPGEWLEETPRTATAAGGTHPIGMHSCSVII